MASAEECGEALETIMEAMVPANPVQQGNLLSMQAGPHGLTLQQILESRAQSDDDFRERVECVLNLLPVHFDGGNDNGGDGCSDMEGAAGHSIEQMPVRSATGQATCVDLAEVLASTAAEGPWSTPVADPNVAGPARASTPLKQAASVIDFSDLAEDAAGGQHKTQGRQKQSRPTPLDPGAREFISRAVAHLNQCVREEASGTQALQCIMALLDFARRPEVTHSTASPVVNLVASLVNVPALTVKKAASQAHTQQQQGRQPPKATQHEERHGQRQQVLGKQTQEQVKPPCQQKALKVLIRQCLGNATKGRAASDLPEDMGRMHAAEVPVGRKYLNSRFARVAEHIGARVVGNAAANLFHRPMAGLGIPSDLELFFDPGTIGRVFRSVRGTVILIGVIFSSPIEPSMTVFVDAPPEPIDGGPEAKLEQLLQSLERSALGLTIAILRARLAISVTDGAYAGGEKNRKGHNPSRALPMLWVKLGRAEVIGWDAFHRWSAAGKRVMDANELANEFFQLTRDLEFQFGFGQGRMLDRQVASFMGVQFRVGKTPGGTREFVYLSGAPERFIQKLPVYHRAILLRQRHAEDGRTSKPLAFWVQLGQRVTSLPTILFGSILGHGLGIMAQHVRLLQVSGCLPDARARSHREVQSKLTSLAGAVDSVNWWVRMFALLHPYLDARSAKRGIYWLVAHRAWRACPQLPAVLPDLLLGQTIRGLGVCSNWQELPLTQCFLHRGCQCAFRASPPLPPPGRPKLPARDFESAAGVSTNVPLRGKVLKWCPLWVTRGSPLLQPHDIRDAKRCPHRAWHLVDQQSMRQVPQAACRIQPQTAHAFQEAETALVQSSQFWHSLVEELSCVEGETGVSHHLASHWRWYEACFDFQKLVVESPPPPEDHPQLTAIKVAPVKQIRSGAAQPMHSSSCGTWHTRIWCTASGHPLTEANGRT